jgi:hypothetical protein
MNPRLQPAQKRLRWALVGLLGVFLAVFAIIPLAPLGAGPLPFCGFRSLSGLPCPLCGGTRAAQATLQGDLARALYLNPLAIAVIAALVLLLLTAATELLRGRPLADWTALSQRWAPWSPVILLTVLLLWWPPHLVSALRQPKLELLDLRNPVARAAQACFARQAAGP